MTDIQTQKKHLVIVDYGIGNQTSLQASCRKIGHRAVISNEINELDKADILLLPGVGAFPKAMKNLHTLGLVDYLKKASEEQRGIIGICLGMQLMTESSSEIKQTQGLGLIPGNVDKIKENKWHIGWNNLEVKERNSKLLQDSDGEVVYFNHSFCYNGPKKYIIAVSRINSNSEELVAAIQRRHLVGLQFHPEKSQQAGLNLLSRTINNIG